MPSARTTIVRWTGRGSQANLESSISHVLALNKEKWSVRRAGAAFLVEGPDPVKVASALGRMPGIAWIAVGTASNSFRELGRGAEALARKYLRPGVRFSVLAESSGNMAVGDIAGFVASSALEEVKGARIDDATPQVKFRATLEDLKGAVGVELSVGPGGFPTGTQEVTCLASGGRHSSVLCWLALLSGFRVSIVHAEQDEESLQAVAYLYAELSHRIDPAIISLEVLRGAEPGPLVLWRGKKRKERTFGGFHAGCSKPPGHLKKKVEAPLFLLPEEYFDREYRALSLKEYGSTIEWKTRPAKRAKSVRIAGVRADVSQVLDGLR
ncbi:MAG: hypothetical protein OK404_02245 [Thaumarchaeota archaeon]|nr:hypothetical protein [Nitrososphaerota archaeon]